MKHVTYEKIQRMYRETNDADLKIRYLAMLKFMEGYTSLKVAELLNASGSTVREWLNRYNTFGPDGLIPQKPKGSECRLTDEQLAKIQQVLLESPKEHGFNKSNWTMSVLKI
jgi:transposase